MKKLLLLTIIPAFVAILALPTEGTDASVAGPPTDVRPEYLTLGDSLAVGVGASDPATAGYVPQIHAYLQDALDPGNAHPAPLDSVPDAFNRKLLRLNDLGVGGPGAPPGGETTGSMISGGQLTAAVAELSAHNGNAALVDDVRVVTLTIGGNDTFAVVPACSGGPSPGCVAAVGAMLGTFTANFNFILGEIRSAAGPDTTIIVMTYPNTLVNPGCPFSSLAPLGDAILEGAPSLGLATGLNDIIRATAAAYGAEVAEAYGRLGASDLQPDCRHPNDSGYQIIADEFIAAYEG
jgi:lysophospholipase L1-like esterase